MSRKRVKRRPKDEPARPSPSVEPAEPGAVRAIRLAGFVALAAGAAVALADPGAVSGAVAAAVALAGTVSAVAAGFYRDRVPRRAHLPRRRSPIAFSLGTLLLLGGAAALLYPCFVTRETFRQIAEAFTYGPLVAVAFAFSGIALLIDGIDRVAPGEPRFALEKEHGTIFDKLRELNPKHFFWDTWKELDGEAARARAKRAAAGETGYDWRPLAVFSTGAVFLALMEYFGHAPTLRELVEHFDPLDPADLGPPDSVWALIRVSPFRRLIEFAWWSGWRVLGFFLLPALVVRVLLRERIADHGLQTRGFLEHAWIYALFFAIVLVAVVVVSYDEHFTTYYPFYEFASRSWYDFWTWELLYAAQFFSLEFFFRGFWLKASKDALGSHAIYAMVVPYCMIHFGKPFLETLAAILAGIVLGTLALRTRSIWSGFLIHVSVAISMDIAALLQTTGLPDQWWPSV